MLLRHARLPFRHSPDASMVLAVPRSLWIPAFAGMTGVMREGDGALRGTDEFMGLNAFDLFRLGASGVVKVPTQLQIDPKIRRRAKVSG